MTDTAATLPRLTDADLDRLEALLDTPPFAEAMRLDEIQGLICAALAGPEPIPEEEWIADALGEAAATDPAGPEAASLLRRLAAELAGQMEAGEPPLLYLYPKTEAEDAPSDFGPWCAAYLHGVDGAAADWFEAGLDEEELEWVDERLFPFMVLTGEAEAAAREHGEEWPEGEELARLESECEDEVAFAATELYRFWIAKRTRNTVRRDTPKVGRNDPCPCGSGKKYKQCCGAA